MGQSRGGVDVDFPPANTSAAAAATAATAVWRRANAAECVLSAAAGIAAFPVLRTSTSGGGCGFESGSASGSSSNRSSSSGGSGGGAAPAACKALMQPSQLADPYARRMSTGGITARPPYHLTTAAAASRGSKSSGGGGGCKAGTEATIAISSIAATAPLAAELSALLAKATPTTAARDAPVAAVPGAALPRPASAPGGRAAKCGVEKLDPSRLGLPATHGVVLGYALASADGALAETVRGAGVADEGAAVATAGALRLRRRRAPLAAEGAAVVAAVVPGPLLEAASPLSVAPEAAPAAAKEASVATAATASNHLNVNSSSSVSSSSSSSPKRKTRFSTPFCTAALEPAGTAGKQCAHVGAACTGQPDHALWLQTRAADLRAATGGRVDVFAKAAAAAAAAGADGAAAIALPTLQPLPPPSKAIALPPPRLLCSYSCEIKPALSGNVGAMLEALGSSQLLRAGAGTGAGRLDPSSSISSLMGGGGGAGDGSDAAARAAADALVLDILREFGVGGESGGSDCGEEDAGGHRAGGSGNGGGSGRAGGGGASAALRRMLLCCVGGVDGGVY